MAHRNRKNCSVLRSYRIWLKIEMYNFFLPRFNTFYIKLSVRNCIWWKKWRIFFLRVGKINIRWKFLTVQMRQDKGLLGNSEDQNIILASVKWNNIQLMVLKDAWLVWTFHDVMNRKLSKICMKRFLAFILYRSGYGPYSIAAWYGNTLEWSFINGFASHIHVICYLWKFYVPEQLKKQ